MVTCFKNENVIKNFDDVISHQSEIKKFQVFHFSIIFQNMIMSAILISTSENSTALWICELGCITVTENNISQMVKIEESENFHRRRRMTSSLKMATFLEKFICQKHPM